MIQLINTLNGYYVSFMISWYQLILMIYAIDFFGELKNKNDHQEK